MASTDKDNEAMENVITIDDSPQICPQTMEETSRVSLWNFNGSMWTNSVSGIQIPADHGPMPGKKIFILNPKQVDPNASVEVIDLDCSVPQLSQNKNYNRLSDIIKRVNNNEEIDDDQSSNVETDGSANRVSSPFLNKVLQTSTLDNDTCIKESIGSIKKHSASTEMLRKCSSSDKYVSEHSDIVVKGRRRVKAKGSLLNKLRTSLTAAHASSSQSKKMTSNSNLTISATSISSPLLSEVPHPSTVDITTCIKESTGSIGQYTVKMETPKKCILSDESNVNYSTSINTVTKGQKKATRMVEWLLTKPETSSKAALATTQSMPKANSSPLNKSKLSHYESILNSLKSTSTIQTNTILQENSRHVANKPECVTLMKDNSVLMPLELIPPIKTLLETAPIVNKDTPIYDCLVTNVSEKGSAADEITILDEKLSNQNCNTTIVIDDDTDSVSQCDSIINLADDDDVILEEVPKLHSNLKKVKQRSLKGRSKNTPLKLIAGGLISKRKRKKQTKKLLKIRNQTLGRETLTALAKNLIEKSEFKNLMKEHQKLLARQNDETTSAKSKSHDNSPAKSKSHDNSPANTIMAKSHKSHQQSSSSKHRGQYSELSPPHSKHSHPATSTYPAAASGSAQDRVHRASRSNDARRPVYGAGDNLYNPNPLSLSDQRGLRPIIIDGSNVAISHGGNSTVFSSKGLLICVNFFLRMKHTVYAFVPLFRRSNYATQDPHILDGLEKSKILIFTPSRRIDGHQETPYDDRYIIQAAVELGGVIVSKDNYRDLIGESPAFADAIRNRLLMYTWLGDILMFPQDPRGRHGPTLDRFLRF